MRPGDESGGASTSASGDDGHLLRLLRSSEDDPDGVLRWLIEICRAVSESTEGGPDAGPADGNDADVDAAEERRARLEALGVRARALFETWQRARASGTPGGDGTRPTEHPNCLTSADAASSLVRFRERCVEDEWSSAAAARLQALAPPAAVQLGRGSPPEAIPFELDLESDTFAAAGPGEGGPSTGARIALWKNLSPRTEERPFDPGVEERLRDLGYFGDR